MSDKKAVVGPFDMKQIDPSAGKLVLVKETKGLTPDALQALADDLVRRLGHSCVLISVKALSDIRQMDEKEMAKYGWVKAEKLKGAESRLSITITHLKLLWDEIEPLYKIIDMSQCPHDDGLGRAIWVIKNLVAVLTPPPVEEGKDEA